MKKSHKTQKPINNDLEGGDKQFDHIIPIQANPIEVEVRDSFDKALKHFRMLVQKEKVISIFKEKQSYEKPSDKKRRKRAENKRKALDTERRSEHNKKRKSKTKTASSPTSNKTNE